MTAIDCAGIDLWGGFKFALAIIAALILVALLDHVADARASVVKKEKAVETKRADYNLTAFNYAMKGRTFIVGEGEKALFTCPALESKI